MPVNVQLFIDWNGDGDWSDTGEEVTSSLLPDVICERGRDQIRIFAPPMAGRLDAALNNASMLFSPSGDIRIAEDGSTRITEDGNIRITSDSSIEPGKPVKLTVDAKTVWTGQLDDIEQDPQIGSKRAVLHALGIISRFSYRSVSTALYSNIRTDQALGYLLDALNWPTVNRVLSTGDTTLEDWWLDDADPVEAMIQILNTEGAGAALYEDQDGKLVFENRNYRALTSRSFASQGSFSTVSNITNLIYSPNYKDIINRCTLSIAHRQAEGLQEIWALGSDVTFAANETKTFQVHANEPFVNCQVPSAAPSNAVQTLTPSTTLTSGTFKLTFKDVTTAGTVAYNASAATIQTALEGLSTIGSGNVLCVGGPINTSPVVVTFIGTLAGREVTDLISISANTLNLTGVAATIEASEVRAGNGTFTEVQRITPSGVLATGSFTITLSTGTVAGTTGSITYNATAATIQTAIQAVTGFGSTTCGGGPISTSSVIISFTYTNDLPLVVITTSGLATSPPSASIAVTQNDKGGVPDYTVIGGGTIVAKSLDRTSGQSCTLSMTAGASGSVVTGLRLRAQPKTVARSDKVDNSDDTSASIAKYGLRSMNPSIRQEISRATALAVANSYTAFYTYPRPTVEFSTASVLGSLSNQLDRQISDRITVTDAQVGIDTTFWIERIRHSMGINNALITEFGCEKATHGDAHSDTHSDTAHADTAAHGDAHTDTAHSDVAHTDDHTDAGVHADVAHVDSHTDTHTDDLHSDAAHGDVAHSDAHSDDIHSDSHSDSHGDTAHSDTHTDDAHTDSHADIHTDDSDPPFHGDTHTDTHSDVAHGDTHSDVAHSDAAHADSHTDTAPHGDSHGDVIHSDDAHADVAHGDVAHVDTHSDTAHTDSAHSDTHSDIAHSDTAHSDTHTDAAHSDTAHGDSHSDAHGDAA